MPARSAAATSYAKALFELAREQGRVEPVARELERVRELLTAEPALRSFLGRPWIGAAAKHTVIEAVAARLDVSRLTRDFFALVAARGRAELLDAMAEAYRGRLDDHLGRVRARVRTVLPLTDDERRILATRLSAALGGKTVVIEEVVDRSLLGGFVAEIGSLIVDGSLDGQLARMRERLARA